MLSPDNSPENHHYVYPTVVPFERERSGAFEIQPPPDLDEFQKQLQAGPDAVVIKEFEGYGPIAKSELLTLLGDHREELAAVYDVIAARPEQSPQEKQYERSHHLLEAVKILRGEDYRFTRAA